MIHPHSKRHRRLMTSKPRLHAAEEPFYRRNPSKTSTKTEKREGGREVLREQHKDEKQPERSGRALKTGQTRGAFALSYEPGRPILLLARSGCPIIKRAFWCRGPI